MHVEQLRRILESFNEALPLLRRWQVRDGERGWRNLIHLATSLGPDATRQLVAPLGRLLPRSADPDMALNNLERFLSTPAGAAALPAVLEARARTLETLVQLFSTSQSFSDMLVANPDFLSMLGVPLRRSPSQAEMEEQLRGEVTGLFEYNAVLRAFRRFRQRQTLRIGTNDVIRDRPLEEITRDISNVADVCLEVALETAQARVAERFGRPYTTAGVPARCVILAFGKLGGRELNYSSDIDVMLVYDDEGSTRGPRGGIGNDDFFARVTGEVVRLLSAHTDFGQAYRVDLRLRPEGERGPLARSLASTIAYYDALGRTWERQALIKLRPVAGDAALGAEFLRAIEPFVYRRYLSFAEINEIKAHKRRIEHKNEGPLAKETDVKSGHGGIRDVEFTIQFLQLLNGGDLPEVRQQNTLLAIDALEHAGCLTEQERSILDDTYRFLRKTEHRLQLLFDLQTHSLPEEVDELRKLALRMGYNQYRRRAASANAGHPLERFLSDYREKTGLNRRILDHLLHQTFEGEGAEPESDLILDPSPEEDHILEVLARYPFRDPMGAYRNLTMLARESVPFLSTPRCRQFLASIAPQLLRTLADTPDPDMALLNLEKVTASLGNKGVLWELFSFNPPSLRLYVDLCAYSQFLSEILIHNPGMVDELLDSLVLNQPRTLAELRRELDELCRGAADIELILHSFQQKELLRVGVRDILGKDTIESTTVALTDIAETILGKIVQLQEAALLGRFGEPRFDGRLCRYALLGLGKVGGREMGYHSDVDLILIYEGDGRTAPPAGAAAPPETTDNFHYFTELAQRIIKVAGSSGPHGRLYQVDMRLRPTGRSGSLVIPLDEFVRYHESGGAQLWERQALTRGRVVHGEAAFAEAVSAAVAQAAYGPTWQPHDADEILKMRQRLEASRRERDVKRGFGGVVDVEFLVQLLQLKYGGRRPELRTPNTPGALDALRRADLLSATEHVSLRDGYDFLRLVESRLRIVHDRSVDELPETPEDLDKLARRLGFEPTVDGSAGRLFLAELERRTAEIRQHFLETVAREKKPEPRTAEDRGIVS